VDTERGAMHAERRRAGELGLRDDVAGRRLGAGKADAGRPAHAAPPAVAADEKARLHRAAVAELD
jgi:hypothetical protein